MLKHPYNRIVSIYSDSYRWKCMRGVVLCEWVFCLRVFCLEKPEENTGYSGNGLTDCRWGGSNPALNC